MPRKARTPSCTDIYHIIIRSINQQDLFLDDEDHIQFLTLLDECHDKYDFSLYGYCIMSNHVHLLLRAEFIQLYSIFKSLGTRFVKWYNIKYCRFGHLFQDRYKSVPIENERSFFNVLNYIHQNPVKANMILYASDYRWSSFNAYYGSHNSYIDISFANLLAGSVEHLHEIFKQPVNYEDFKENHEALPHRHTPTDADAMQLFFDKCNCSSPSDFQRLNRTEQQARVIILTENGITYNQISRLCGISKRTVSRFIKGK